MGLFPANDLQNVNKKLKAIESYSFENMLQNSNFENADDWVAQYGSGTASNNIYTYTTVTLSSSARIQQTLTKAVTEGHKYYIHGYINPEYITNIYVRTGNKSVFFTDFVANEFNEINTVLTAESSATTFQINVQTNTLYSVGDTVQYKYLCMIDMTEAFGVGNEKTVDEMKEFLKTYDNYWFDGTIDNIYTIKKTVEMINNLEDDLNDSLGEVVIPKYIPCVIGKKLNIHYNNILMHQTYTSVSNISIRNISNYRNLAIINPSDSNDISASVQCMSGTKWLNGCGTITIKPIDVSAGSGLSKKVLFIGDSITNRAQYTSELLSMFEDDVMSIELIGTKTGEGTGNNHEGYSGVTAYDFIHSQTIGTSSETNPFYNTTTSVFDFTYYMTNNSISSVDYVFIVLGTNDTRVDKQYTDYQAIIDNYNTMIDSIKAYNSDIKICISMTILKSTNVAQTYTNRIDVLGFNKALVEYYSSKESEGIYLVPTYVHVDPEKDYSSQEITYNDHSTDTITEVTDTTHPSLSGMQKMADVYYNFIKYVATL